ncbi:hypothetical protein PUN28_011874 [Cardiocondyla obscurior]|uniref:Uncharacterized protein n=1 Tax=Cardiocondyla obscurior TaxID=286306 RepID=A0AAW2FIK4_9HYME
MTVIVISPKSVLHSSRDVSTTEVISHTSNRGQNNVSPWFSQELGMSLSAYYLWRGICHWTLTVFRNQSILTKCFSGLIKRDSRYELKSVKYTDMLIAWRSCPICTPPTAEMLMGERCFLALNN